MFVIHTNKQKIESTFTFVAAQNIDENNNCKFEKKQKKNILATFSYHFFCQYLLTFLFEI